jgi:hypothetical protein
LFASVSGWSAVVAAGLDSKVIRLSTPSPDSGTPEPVSRTEALKVPSLSPGKSPASKILLLAFRASMLVACALMR